MLIGAMLRAVFVILMLLSGCTTTHAEMRSRDVAGTFQTDKPAAVVATCLAETFSRIGTPLILDRENEKQISINYEGSVVLMFTIANGTVSVQRASSLIAYRDKTAACV